MNASTRRLITLLAAAAAALVLIVAMFAAPRFFTGSPEAFYTPASAQLPAAPPEAVTDLDPQAPRPDTAILTAQLDAILASKPDGTSFSAQVVDVDSGEVLYDKDATRPGVPASSLKVATAIAALDTMGGDTQLATTTFLDGNTLVLRGGGDVLLGDGKSDPSHPNGYAGLETLAERTAQELAERGVGEVQLWLDDSLFGDAHSNTAWDKSLFTSNNIAPIYPIAHYAGRVSDAYRAAHENDSAQQVRQVFAAALAKHVKVSQGGRGAYEGCEEIASVLSAPLREQVKYMLLVSDNYVTETVGRLVAVNRQMDAGQAAQAVQQVAGELGVQGLELFDTSGLAAKNRVSPAALTGLLRAASTSPKAEVRELVYSLPVSGYSGTLMQRLNSAADRGLIRAKTGSLSGVATLTGLTLTADGRLISFSIFASHPDGGLAPHKQTIDQAVSTLHSCGCR